MEQTITVWGIAIPSAISSAIGALVMWFLNTRSKRRIKQLESRLHREEDAYKLVQSPRVRSAIKAWSAFCAYERSVDLAFGPGPWVKQDDSQNEIQMETFELFDEDPSDWMKAAAEAWQRLSVAKDRAECLLDEPTFSSFEALYNSYRNAWLVVGKGSIKAKHGGGDKIVQHITETYNSASRILLDARNQRATVLKAVRSLIAPEAHSAGKTP